MEKALKRRLLTARCETPICGAVLSDLKCDSFDITRCHWVCPKELKAIGIQLDLFSPTEEEIEEIYRSDSARKDVTCNMDREEWEGR